MSFDAEIRLFLERYIVHGLQHHVTSYIASSPLTMGGCVGE